MRICYCTLPLSKGPEVCKDCVNREAHSPEELWEKLDSGAGFIASIDREGFLELFGSNEIKHKPVNFMHRSMGVS